MRHRAISIDGHASREGWLVGAPSPKAAHEVEPHPESREPRAMVGKRKHV